ncbi:MAG: hypothetical protein AB7S78_06280 [Candidatus Omnitrophota bacterium]
MNIKRLVVRILFIAVMVLMFIKTQSVPPIRELTHLRVHDRQGHVRIKRFLKYGNHGEMDVHFDEQGKPITGACFNYHQVYKIRQVGMCRNGLFHGQVLGYTDNSGRPTVVGYFENGLREGEFRTYQAGQLVGTLDFKKGKMDGMLRGYYANGNLRYEKKFKNNLREGLSKHYYENGRLKDLGYFKAGKQNGRFWYWDDQGVLAWEMTFKDGWEAEHSEQFDVKSVISGDTILLGNNQRVHLKGIEEVASGKDSTETPRQILKEILQEDGRFKKVRLEFTGPPAATGDWEAYLFVDTGHTRYTLRDLNQWNGPKDYYLGYFPVRVSHFVNATLVRKGAARATGDAAHPKYTELLKSLEL